MVAKKAKDRKQAGEKKSDKGRYAEVAAAVIELNRKALEALKDK